MALAAFEILATIPELQRLAGVDFELRVGIHCGPVVGGVVGVKNPRYHVFGQSVALGISPSKLIFYIHNINNILLFYS